MSKSLSLGKKSGKCTDPHIIHHFGADELGDFQNFNPLPNDVFWAPTKVKAFADEKSNVAKMLISLFDRVENISKGENAGFQHFLLFLQFFQKAYFSGS